MSDEQKSTSKTTGCYFSDGAPMYDWFVSEDGGILGWRNRIRFVHEPPEPQYSRPIGGQKATFGFTGGFTGSADKTSPPLFGSPIVPAPIFLHNEDEIIRQRAVIKFLLEQFLNFYNQRVGEKS